MKFTKKIASLMLLGLIVFVINACNGNSSNGDNIDRSVIIVGFDVDDQNESDEINATLIGLGYTTTTGDDPNATIIISGAGFYTSSVDGKPYIQISDHGDDLISNSWSSLDPSEEGNVTITLTGSHPILNGVDTTWTTNGFWLYSDRVTEDYIGWATSPDQALAKVTVTSEEHNATLAMNTDEDLLYIGWNVFGSLATPNDVKVLDNAILYMTGN